MPLEKSKSLDNIDEFYNERIKEFSCDRCGETFGKNDDPQIIFSENSLVYCIKCFGKHNKETDFSLKFLFTFVVCVIILSFLMTFL